MAGTSDRPTATSECASSSAVGLLQTGFALEKGFGLVVVAETGGLTISLQLVTLARQESVRDPAAILAADAKVDRGFGKSPIEIADRKPGGGRQQDQADNDETIVGG